jgi:hypothetical protein
MGKTTAQIVGASPLGFGRSQDLPTLNSTPAGLLAAAKATNDHAFFIDEIGTARGPKRDIYVALSDSTYALMSGRDVLRHPSWTGAGGEGPSTFRVIVVLSSEHSPDTWAARNGETRDEGETARLISLPLEALGTSIFDRPPSAATEPDRLLWEREQLARLHEGLPKQRGVSFARYLDAITQKPRKTADRARDLVKRFERHLGSKASSPVARDIVSKFGIFFAGGIVSAEAGVLPIPKRVIASAIRKACLAALSALPDPHANLVGTWACYGSNCPGVAFSIVLVWIPGSFAICRRPTASSVRVVAEWNTSFAPKCSPVGSRHPLRFERCSTTLPSRAISSLPGLPRRAVRMPGHNIRRSGRTEPDPARLRSSCREGSMI